MRGAVVLVGVLAVTAVSLTAAKANLPPGVMAKNSTLHMQRLVFDGREVYAAFDEAASKDACLGFGRQTIAEVDGRTLRTTHREGGCGRLEYPLDWRTWTARTRGEIRNRRGVEVHEWRDGTWHQISWVEEDNGVIGFDLFWERRGEGTTGVTREPTCNGVGFMVVVPMCWPPQRGTVAPAVVSGSIRFGKGTTAPFDVTLPPGHPGEMMWQTPSERMVFCGTIGASPGPSRCDPVGVHE